MTIRLTLLALLCGLLLAPAAAVAQSAGDDQYADPFGDEEQQQAQSTPAPAAPAPAPAPAPPATAPAASAGAAQAPQAAAPGAATLPRTGRDALAAALAGIALIAGGLALRAHAHRLV
jgi:LPXTG-motif cell wall-anchored protein